MNIRLGTHGQRHIDMGEQQELFNDIQSIDRSKGIKICIKCNKEKSIESFARFFQARQTERVCVSCRNKHNKIVSELKKIYKKPDKGFKCPICLKKAIPNLDHDHKTETFKGWICNKCNSALGFFEDDINYVRRAVNYLEKSA